jgi:hypothetical protein
MTRINAGNDVYYWQCERCGYSLNKPKEQSIEEILDDITKEEKPE